MENFHNDTKQLKSSSTIEFFKQLREYQEQLECVEKLSPRTSSIDATHHTFEEILNLSTSTIGEPNSESLQSIKSSSTANFLGNLSEKILSNKGDGSMIHENISSHKEIPVQIQLEGIPLTLLVRVPNSAFSMIQEKLSCNDVLYSLSQKSIIKTEKSKKSSLFSSFQKLFKKKKNNLSESISNDEIKKNIPVVNHQKEYALNFSKKDSTWNQPIVDSICMRSMNESILDPNLTTSQDNVSNSSTILKKKRTDPLMVSEDFASNLSTIMTEKRPDFSITSKNYNSNSSISLKNSKSKAALISTDSKFNVKLSNSLHSNVTIEHKVIPNDNKASGSFSIKIINQAPMQPSDNNESSTRKIENENLKEKKIQPKEQILDSLEKILIKTTEKLNDLDKMKLLMESIEKELKKRISKKNVNVSISKKTLEFDDLLDRVITDVNKVRKDVKTKKNYATQKLRKQSSKFSICSNGTVSSDEEDPEFSREQKIKFSEKFKQCRCPSIIGYKI